jgi:hypothetical protein
LSAAIRPVGTVTRVGIELTGFRNAYEQENAW